MITQTINGLRICHLLTAKPACCCELRLSVNCYLDTQCKDELVLQSSGLSDGKRYPKQ